MDDNVIAVDDMVAQLLQDAADRDGVTLIAMLEAIAGREYEIQQTEGAL